MKKIIAFALILVLCLGIFSGCHGSRGLDAFVLPDEFDTSRNYEIMFWAKNDTNKAQTNIYEKAIADFEALYPNVKVKIRLYTDYGRIYNDVITNISTNTTPNVCITYPDHIATYLTGTNSVVPLDDLFDSSKYGLGGSEVRFDSPTREEIIPQFLRECAFNDRHYAIPYMRSTEACYVNKTFVEKLGFTLPEKLTWDFIWEVSEAAMAQDAEGNFLVNGQKIMIPFIYKSTDNMMIHQTRQLDSGFSTDQGDILLFNDTTKELLQTVAKYAAMDAFSTFKISSYPANFLNAGQCIFAIDSTAGATWMGSDAPLIDIAEDKLVKFETAIMEVPQFDHENPQMISQGPSICVFNKEDPQEVLASWLFTQFLLTNDVQIAYAQTEGYVPVTSKAQNDPTYQDYLSRCGEDNNFYYDIKIQASQLLLNNTDNTFVTPVFNGSTSLRNAAGQLIEEVTKSSRRGEAIDDAYLNKLFSNVKSMYRLDQTGLVSGGKDELGPMPKTAVALLGILAGVWILIGIYAGWNWIKKKKLEKDTLVH